jgi:tetratricopeptide (TPR) repeat protein
MFATDGTLALLNQAVAAQRGGRAEEAASLYHQVLSRDPGNADALHLLGVMAAERDDAREATALMAAAVLASPGNATIHYNYAKLLQRLGRCREALGHFDTALALEPASAPTWYNRGNCLDRMGMTADALESYEQALGIRPAYAAALLNRGVVLQKLGSFDDAATSYREALLARPGYVQAMCNLGNLLRIQGKWAEAREVCEEAAAQHPQHAKAHAHLANVLQHLGKTREALRVYEKALARTSDLASARWNRSLLLLRMGEYREGWREFEWRKRLTSPVAVREFAQPAWTGAEDIVGKTVFLYWEQGLGDTLQFCRFAPMVRARGADVVLSVPDPLVRLMRTLSPGISVISTHAVPSRFDFHCALMSLPAALDLTLSDLPGITPYLSPSPSEVEKWRGRLAAVPGRKVGLVWSGAPRPEDFEANAIDQRRSLPLAEFEPLGLVPGVSFISLQKGPKADQIGAAACGLRVMDWSNELYDFHSTAALVAALDLVISVDTSVAHLAGALGAPVWILNRYDHCWRWLTGVGQSPWYPSAYLYRQSCPGNWANVISEVATDLGKWTSAPTR